MCSVKSKGRQIIPSNDLQTQKLSRLLANENMSFQMGHVKISKMHQVSNSCRHLSMNIVLLMNGGNFASFSSDLKVRYEGGGE